MMDSKHRNILITLRYEIVRDLDVSQILDVLISQKVVNVTKANEIQNCPDRESRNQILLDYLPHRGPEAYAIFKEALRSYYGWISKKMDNLELEEDSIDLPDSSLGQNIPHPHLPTTPHFKAKRIQKTEQLLKGLRELKPRHYLALHALQGYGKSCLVSVALEDRKLLRELFQDEIYWIKFGQHQSLAENILVQLNMLFHRVRNLDMLMEPTSEESLKYSLQHHFTAHENALLILDDVNKREIIEAFDFGCKTLVLTTDTDILRGRNNSVIDMNDGFSIEESLDLFSKAIGVPIADLPKQARQIHDECKGMPLIIAMFSAQFEDLKELLAGQSDEKAPTWSFFLDALRRKDSIVLQESLDKLAAIFDMCISKLRDDEMNYYKTLAIFPQDVNITTKTLAVFWGLDPTEVDSRMLKFCKKSLAVRQFHEEVKTYIYGVHDLVLSHLRSQLTPRALMDLHKSYIEKNFRACNEDFSKLPLDNYLYSYIGHHMEQAGMLDRFPDLYLDFGFIETKVYHIGPGDLLIDLKKYRIYITQDSPDLLQKVEDLEKFLVQQASTLAEYRRRNCLDLVQVALKHPYPGFVKDTAISIANKKVESLYIRHLEDNTHFLNSYSEELHMQVQSVAFTNEANVILVGNNTGKIILWKCNDRHHGTFYGNNPAYPIRKIIVSQSGKFFISISEDGMAKLFNLPIDYNKPQSGYDMKTLNPRAKQPNWRTMYESGVTVDDSRVTFSVPGQKIMDIAISENGDKIAACTNAGYIAVWDTDGGVLLNPVSSITNGSFDSIIFTTGSTLLHTVNLANRAVVVFEASNGQYKTQSSLWPETSKILALLSVPEYENLLIVLLETKVVRRGWAPGNEVFSHPSMKVIATLTNGITYTCATVTQDGRYVVTADTGGSVNVYNLHDDSNLVRTFKSSVTSLDTYWLREDGRHIICGGNRDTLVPMVHRFKFNPMEDPVVERLALFDATIEPGMQNVVAVATSSQTIQILESQNVIAETPAADGKITSLLIYDNGSRVLYAASNGSVFLFDIKHNDLQEIMQLPHAVNFMTVLNIDNEYIIVCEHEDTDLQIWKNMKDNHLVENSGSVILCELLTIKNQIQCILTVAKTVIKVWDPKKWQLKTKHQPIGVPDISCCSLSENYLAIANENGSINVLKLVAQENRHTVAIEDLFFYTFPKGITACRFSHDRQFLAAGCTNGDIEIIRTVACEEIRTLQFHRHPVKRLHWGPLTSGEYILLSLTKELAWWSISQTETTRVKKVTTREISHSLSELSVAQHSNGVSTPSTTMRTSQSLELTRTQVTIHESLNNDSVFLDTPSSISSLVNTPTDAYMEYSFDEINGNGQHHSSIWNGKKPKYSHIPKLLNVIKLEGDSAPKVCISRDFTKFFTIDGEGYIRNLAIFEPKENYNDGDNA